MYDYFDEEDKTLDGAFKRTKEFIKTVALAVVIGFFLCVVISGCTTAPVPLATFNDQAAAVVQSVTTVRRTATALFTAGKITDAQDVQLQAKLDQVIAAVKSAKTLTVTDPLSADAQLQAAINQLAALKAQTGVTP